ncbi:hypothetical protein HSIEG1_2721 [Enterococcus sp. HSIEG1]|nr:hypothetical protein HSIEG1_2721 [Enterococcus sp. HSIEG1]
MKRKTFAPASISSEIISTLLLAGPNVLTIFVFSLLNAPIHLFKIA